MVNTIVITTFLLGVLSIPIIGRIMNIVIKDIKNPMNVFVTTSTNDCFLVCIIM